MSDLCPPQDVLDGQPFQLSALDEAWLRRRVGGLLVRQDGGCVLRRLVGDVVLPSGRRLRVRSAKSSAASLLSWLGFCDPTLADIRLLGHMPETASDGSLGELAAALFCQELERVLLRDGTMRRYARTVECTADIRGAIDFGRLAHIGGDVSRIPCRVWRRMPQTPLNGTLAATLQCIRRHAMYRVTCARWLPKLDALLSDVRPIVDYRLVAGTLQLDRMERGFDGVLALARILLRTHGVGEGAERTGLAFLVNIEKLFEKTVALAFAAVGASPNNSESIGYFRVTGEGIERTTTTEHMPMDVFLPPSHPCGPLIIDAKYKTEVAAGNLHQMVTYCIGRGVRRAVMVFPAGHLVDRRSYEFPIAGGKDAVRIDLAELATSGQDVGAWHSACQKLVGDVLGPWTSALRVG